MCTNPKFPVNLLTFNMKQLLDALTLAIKMCNGLARGVLYGESQVCAVSVASHLLAVAEVFCPLRTLITATEQLRGERRKSEVILIASTKTSKTMEAELSY